jgi:hypothetical protein
VRHLQPEIVPANYAQTNPVPILARKAIEFEYVLSPNLMRVFGGHCLTCRSSLKQLLTMLSSRRSLDNEEYRRTSPGCERRPSDVHGPQLDWCRHFRTDKWVHLISKANCRAASCVCSRESSESLQDLHLEAWDLVVAGARQQVTYKVFGSGQMLNQAVQLHPCLFDTFSRFQYGRFFTSSDTKFTLATQHEAHHLCHSSCYLGARCCRGWST